MSNATGCSFSALPDVASNATQVASGLNPREKPLLPQLLGQPQSCVFRSQPETICLFAWNLSSMDSKNPSDNFLPASMTVSCKFVRVGVVQIRLFHSKPLFSNEQILFTFCSYPTSYTAASYRLDTNTVF